MLAACAAAIMAVACDGKPLGPSERGQLPLAFTFELGAAGGAGEAFDQADAIGVRVQAGTVTVLDTVFPFQPDDEVAIRLVLDGDVTGTLRVDVELLFGTAPLFVGSGTAALDDAGTAEVMIALSPVAFGIALPVTTPVLDAIGGSVQLQGALIFATGDTIRTSGLTWSALDPDVVSVTPEGLAIAESEGDARVQARSEAMSAEMTIRVRQVAAAVEITPPDTVLVIGESVRFQAEARDANGHSIANRNVAWSTSEPLIVAIEADGEAVAVGAGTATLTATIDEAAATAEVVVLDSPPPVAPGNPSALASGTTVTLIWADEAETETEYRVLRDDGTTTPVLIATLGADSERYVDGTEQVDVRFTYIVQACNPSGCTSSTPVTVSTVPRAPASLSALPGSGLSDVELQWIDNSAQELEFAIERSATANGPWTRLHEVAQDVTQTQATGTPGGTDHFRVLACNDAGCTGTTNQTSISLPAPAVLTLPSTGPAIAAGSVNGAAYPEAFVAWFEFQRSPALLESSPMANFAFQYYGPFDPQSPFEQQLLDTNCFSTAAECVNANQTLYYRIVVQDTLGNLVRGDVETTDVPELTPQAPAATTLCNGDTGGVGVPQPCPTNPSSVLVVATSSGPAGTYANPFSSVEFREGTTYSIIGPTTVSITDDGITRTYHYSTTFDATNIPPNPEAIWVVGYGNPGGAPVYGGFIVFTIVID